MEKYRKILETKKKQKRNEAVKKITLSVAISAAAGALSALFIAPKSEEINKSLIKATDTVKDKVNTSIEFGKEKVKNIAEVVEKRVERAEKKAEHIKEDVVDGEEVDLTAKETEEDKKIKDDIKKDIKK